MKSAYELAMERFDDDEFSTPLTEEQKEQLAEIDKKFDAKIAERSIFLNKQIGQLTASGEAEEADMVHKQLLDEKARLNEERETEKNKARSPRA